MIWARQRLHELVKIIHLCVKYSKLHQINQTEEWAHVHSAKCKINDCIISQLTTFSMSQASKDG